MPPFPSVSGVSNSKHSPAGVVFDDQTSMTSSTSSSIMASAGANANSYDVFLSFSGEDTRHSFTDHLYDTLKRAGINAFRDNEEIKIGEELKIEIKRAIKESKGSIVVLSENYATSTWCLDELTLILQQRRECNHFVLPVFYHVDPSHVRKQTNTFAIEVKASSRWTDDNVNLWRSALKEVADLRGMDSSGPETKLLERIVHFIYDQLDHKEVHLPINLVGMAARYRDIKLLLNGSNDEFLAIYGMGGSGKTTLAKYIFDSNCQKFDYVSFVEGICTKCKESYDLLELQEQLLKDLSGGKKRKVPSVCQGTLKIEEALQVKTALIVLDDIDEMSQLVALLGSGYINKQSKIIITTRENNIGKWFEFRSWRCQEYQMKLLDDDESLELLSRHAFGSKSLMEGYEKLAKQVLQYCEGNPLALEVLGSSLAEDNSFPFWESTLSLLGRDIHDKIQRVLIRSYNTLPHVSNKELFLHIACFFVGKDIDYVVKILEHDYSALSGIKTLTKRCLLSVTPNKKLMMHPLIQEMGRTIVHQEAPKDPAKRSRVWRNKDSYDVLRKGKGSETVEGLALDMQMLTEENCAFKALDLKTDALKKMDKLKFLHLHFVQLDGSYENVSEDLRWLCWFGTQLIVIPSDLSMGNLVAIDMSYSQLEVFDPPMVLQSLRILNLKDSRNLFEICNMSRIPHLETLILWNCQSLVRVCETIGDLMSLSLLNMTGCINLCKWQKTNLLVGLKASTSGRGVAEQPNFSFPHSLHRLFLNGCNLECTDSFPLRFSDQPSLEYLNLGNSLFEFLPCYNHLKNLRVLDLSFCSRLKWILCLPSTLAELYVYYCTLLEKISFQSPRFTLQEFGYEGCFSLCEIEGFIKLVPIAKLEENNLGHMKWLKEYQNHEVCLVGDDEFTKGRSLCVQLLYEFDIRSTSLPCIKDPNMKPDFISEFSYMSLEVPLCPKNRRLKGLDVTFKYTVSGDDDWVWFCKISTTNGVDLMYNPKVFGKPDSDKVGIWLSYWPIGNTLNTGDKVSVSIVVMRGLKVHECGVSLVYSDDKVDEETLENNTGWAEVLGGDLSGFQLSTGAYYLCRRDFFELVEVGGLTRGWFRILVGGTVDYTEVQGWRKTGRPKQLNPLFAELRTVRCIIRGPESEEIYNIAEMSKSSFVDKTLKVTSNMLGEMTKSATSPIFSDTISIASGSYSSTKAAPDDNDSIYDVFLTFSSRDIRYSFADHLYKALKQARIVTKRDSKEYNIIEELIPRLMPELTPEIRRVIERSRSSIIVLSQNYATSSYYLDELLLILEQRRERDHFVLPIYYQVDPSDVRNQQNNFAINVKSSGRWTDHNVNLWKKALREVADLGGLVLLGPETKFLKEIVDTISSKLDGKEIHLPPNVSGMATRYEEINSWLNQSDVQFLAICGMGGSGKTKLAKYIYSSNCESFENLSFLVDIDRRCKESHDLLELQEQLLKDILGGKKRKVVGVSQGTYKIEDALQTKRALIVLDDIANHGQLLTLLGTGKINAQSKIIITTRENADFWFKFTDWRCQVHQMI